MSHEEIEYYPRSNRQEALMERYYREQEKQETLREWQQACHDEGSCVEDCPICEEAEEGEPLPSRGIAVV